MKTLKRLTMILLTCMLLLPCLSNQVVTVSAAEQAASYGSVEEAVVQLREQMVQREKKIVVYVQTKDFDPDSFWSEMISKATAHTGKPTEGDYIQFHLKDISASMEYFMEGDISYVTATFDVAYFSSAKQEAELNAVYAEVMKSLNLDGKTDYEKIKAIYDYITTNITYDYDHKEDDTYLLKESAYAALVNKTCVCQGYANLFYRMALDAGIDCRIISGVSNNENHAWNIVKLDGVYYNVDATWDAGQPEYGYFLKCDNGFADHIRNDEYNTKAFRKAYPTQEHWSDHIASKFAGGKGTKKSPYQIATAEQLARLAYLVNNCVDNYNKAYYQLTADIDISTYEWVPISGFEGIFDGKEYTISGMHFSHIDTDYVGLFGNAYGTIKNVVLKDVVIDTVSGQTSGWVGMPFAGITFVGGLAGEFAGTISNCVADIGINLSTEYTSVEVGGLIGYLVPGSVIEDSHATGSIRINSAKGINAGGLLGYMYGDADGSPDVVSDQDSSIVRRCSFSGTIITDNNGHTGNDQHESQNEYFEHFTGGLIGKVAYGFNQVFDCYALASISAQSEVGVSANALIGYIGLLENDGLTLQRLYSTGKVVFTEFSQTTEYSQGVFAGYPSEDWPNVTITDYGYFDTDEHYFYKYNMGTYNEYTAYPMWDSTVTELFTSTMSFDDDVWNINNDYFPSLDGGPQKKVTHSYKVGKTVKPDCENEGYRPISCTCGCGLDLRYDVKEALGHLWGEEQFLEPTCTQKAYGYYICGRCEATMKSLVGEDVPNAFQWTQGKKVDATTGKLVSDSSWAASNYVDLRKFVHIDLAMPNTSDKKKVAGVAFYDANKNYISGIVQGDGPGFVSGSNEGVYILVLDLPENVAYMRTTWYAESVPLYETYAGEFGCAFYSWYYEAEELPHTPNIPAPTDTEDQVCTACGTVLAVRLSHPCVDITKQPKNSTSKIGEKATFSVTLENATEDMTYQWQVSTNNGDTWKNYSGSGNKTAQISVTVTEENIGYMYRCRITDSACGKKATSKTGQIRTPVVITEQPANATSKLNETAATKVTAVGKELTYQWYYKNAGGSKFLYTSTFKGNTYSVKMTEERNGRQVYCVITDAFGNSVTSDTVALKLAVPVKITTQPKNATAEEGKRAKVTVQATGDGLTYQWYYKNAGASKFSLTTSVTGNAYSTTMNSTRDGRQIYCVITDAYGNSVTTNTVTLKMIVPVKITTQPKNVTVEEGKTAKVTVQATGDGLTYQWYYKNAGASKFSLTTSFKGNSYSVAMNDSRNGRCVYCVVTDKYGNSVTTDTVTLSMAIPVKITKQPVSVTVEEGKVAKVTVQATGDGLTYQWYYANKGTSKFRLTTSFTGNTYSVTMNDSREDRKVYCVITDQYGNQVTTETVTLHMAVRITQQPTDQYTAFGSRATTSVEAKGNGLKYQWYIRNKGASKFTKSSITTATYDVTMNKTNKDRDVYCVITDSAGNSVQTDTVHLYVIATITQQPADVLVANGETAKTTVTAVGDNLTYQWYYKNAGSSKFSKASTTGSAYSTKMSKSVHGRQVYCVITDKYGNSVQTDTVTLRAKVFITTQPADVRVNNTKTAKTTVVACGDGLTYQWYIKNVGSKNFSKSSITKDTYTVTMSRKSHGRQIYCVITDKYGNSVQTDTVTLRANVFIYTQPKSVSVVKGEKATVTVTAYGEGLTYQWYYANKGSDKFSLTTSFKGNTYSVEMNSSRNGRRIYCVITDQYGNQVTTDTVTISMK